MIVRNTADTATARKGIGVCHGYNTQRFFGITMETAYDAYEITALAIFTVKEKGVMALKPRCTMTVTMHDANDRKKRGVFSKRRHVKVAAADPDVNSRPPNQVIG